VVLLSGGIDSSTALFWTKQRTDDLHSLNVLYAQASNREAEASEKIARAAGVREHISVALPFYKDIQDRYKPSPSSNLSAAYVPARNVIFYGIAAAYAETLGADTIVFGSNGDDAKVLPDATQGFVAGMNQLLRIGTRAGKEGAGATIVNPLINLSKAEALRLAVELHVPLELTWSCYEDVQEPCGKCRGCVTRRESFEANGLKDPMFRV